MKVVTEEWLLHLRREMQRDCQVETLIWGEDVNENLAEEAVGVLKRFAILEESGAMMCES